MDNSPFFRRSWTFPNEMLVALSDGDRVRVIDYEGNVFLNCSRWLFEKCWMRGWFEDLPDPTRVLSGAECPG